MMSHTVIIILWILVALLIIDVFGWIEFIGNYFT